jgi:hypothetical protein
MTTREAAPERRRRGASSRRALLRPSDERRVSECPTGQCQHPPTAAVMTNTIINEWRFS